MSISTFIKGLYNKYVLAKPPVKEPVIVKTAPRVTTTHVITNTTPPPKAPPTTAAPVAPKTTIDTDKPAARTTTHTSKATAKTTNPNTNPTPAAKVATTGIIYPVMKLVTDNALTEPDIVANKWLGDLMICYAFDTPQGPQLIHRKDIPAGMTTEKLHETAIESLGKNIEYSLQETSFGGYELVAGGQYEASAVCLPGIWKWLTEQFVDSLLVVIPAKDLVLVIPEQDSHGMYNLHTTVRQAFKSNSQSLTANIFRFNRYSQQWNIIGNAQ